MPRVIEQVQVIMNKKTYYITLLLLISTGALHHSLNAYMMPRTSQTEQIATIYGIPLAFAALGYAMGSASTHQPSPPTTNTPTIKNNPINNSVKNVRPTIQETIFKCAMYKMRRTKKANMAAAAFVFGIGSMAGWCNLQAYRNPSNPNPTSETSK